jgi:Uma2 family endonuclease
MSTQVEPLLTISDLDAMPDDGNRYEIIEGELLVSRAPNLLHQTTSGNLFFSIKSYLSQNPIGQVWATPGIILSEFNGVIPDLVFVGNDQRNEIASGERITGAPDLVVEIVSPGAENARRDRLAKRQLYGRYGVKEYWIVDPYSRNVEVYILEGQMLKLQASYFESDEVVSTVLPGFTCKVENLFRS